MGNEIACNARFGKQDSIGRVLLETNEIIFRGDFRLKIALSEIKSVEAVNGELRIEFPGGKAAFVLGAQAEKWAHKLLHPKTPFEKVGVKIGQIVSVVGPSDANFLKQLKERARRLATGKPLKESDLLFFGAEKASELEKIRKLVAFLKKDGALGIVYPKGQKVVTEGDAIASGRKAGLKDIKVVGFSETHTALKFVLPLAKR